MKLYISDFVIQARRSQRADSKNRNTEGTLNFQPRVHKFDILFTPQEDATVANSSGKNLFFTYKETM
jgi:hypothetical protein